MDPEHAYLFDLHGFVVLRNVLDPSAVAALLAANRRKEGEGALLPGDRCAPAAGGSSWRRGEPFERLSCGDRSRTICSGTTGLTVLHAGAGTLAAVGGPQS